MSFLDKIRRCNTVDYSGYVPLLVKGSRVGWIRHDFLDVIKPYADIFVCDGQLVSLHPDLDTFDARSRAFETVSRSLVRAGKVKQLLGEIYPASVEHREQALFVLDRAVASCFGTRTYGQHLNGYVRKDGQLSMWIGRRAQSRGFYPGKLDQLVAGGLPHGVSLQENLRKECFEEAGIEATLADQARPAGSIGCTYENERGIKPETIYCYDLELPVDFQPQCQDGEVDEFLLLPMDEVAALVRDSDEFKLNCNLVIIDFLLRHGFLTAAEPDYELLLAGLHQ